MAEPTNTLFSNSELKRYARHFTLAAVGISGQEKIKNAKVLCVGVGGLGSSALLYLAAAGVGTLGFIDDDEVDISNLQRQIIFSTSDIDRNKVAVAHDKLKALNPEIRLNPIACRLTKDNALSIIQPYDLVMDCTDNFYSRYLINDACVFLHKPNVYASISGFEGQCSVFSALQGPCYRCLYSTAPLQASIPSCSEAGVMGMLPGLLGSIQAMEAIKLILNQGDPLVGRLLLVDALSMQFHKFSVSKNQECLCCVHKIPFDWLGAAAKPCKSNALHHEISAHDLQALKKSNTPFLLLDVREPFEHDLCNIGGQLIPLDSLAQRASELAVDKFIIIYCKTGGRSQKAASILKRNGFQNVRVLKGGILNWMDEMDSNLNRY